MMGIRACMRLHGREIERERERERERDRKPKIITEKASNRTTTGKEKFSKMCKIDTRRQHQQLFCFSSLHEQQQRKTV